MWIWWGFGVVGREKKKVENKVALDFDKSYQKDRNKNKNKMQRT